MNYALSVVNKVSLSFLLFCISLIMKAQSLDSTNLPLIVINTNGQTIPDFYKISATMKVIANGANKMNKPGDSGNIYNGAIGIEIRGRYSASLPQKPYGIETRDSVGENLNVSLLDMPKENDWILLANYNDKSFVRNSLAFKIFRDMGHYAPRTKLCEVIVNDSYQGIYNFTEKIKIDKNRLNIDDLTAIQNSGDELTGGYVFSIDYYDASNSWISSYSPIGYTGKLAHFVYNFPKPDEISTEQKSYIQNFVKNVEKSLYGNDFKNPTTGYRSYFDVKSFIDYFIVGELSRNVDAYKKSCFYSKSRNSKGGLIAAGPVWDFDWAWKNIWDCSIFKATDGSGWAYKILDCDAWPNATGWIPRLMQDPVFVEEVKQRYASLRKNILSNATLMNYIDSVNNLINQAQVRHYQKWPILGQNVGAPEVEAIPYTYEGETTKFKNWIKTRLAWLDNQLLITSIPDLTNENKSEDFFTINPNPAKESITIEAKKVIQSIAIYNNYGQIMILIKEVNSSKIEIDTKSLSPGFYIAKVSSHEGLVQINKFIIK